MRYALLAVLLVCCGRDHKSERDTKDRSTAIIGGETHSMVEAAAPLPPPPTTYARDTNVVENGPVTLTWSGPITASSGKAPAIGTTCALSTAITMKERNAWTHAWVVTCGSQKLYDENDKLNGTSHTGNSLDESAVAGKVSVFRYALKASDIGARAGDRSQMSISTKDNELVVFREIPPTFRVTIKVPRWTQERSGKPMFDDNVPPFTDVVKKKATLTSSKGPLPFVGKTCELRMSPASAKYSCRVQVECANKIVFGTENSGFENCVVDGGFPVSMVDDKPTPEDSDPKLTVDTNAKTMVLGDVAKDGTTYTASFTLE